MTHPHTLHRQRIAEYRQLCLDHARAGGTFPPMPTTKAPNGAMVDNGISQPLLRDIWEQAQAEVQAEVKDGHWVRRLPEVGSPGLRRAIEIENKQKLIAQHRAEIERLERELENEEQLADAWAANHWKRAEIAAAKKEAK